MGESLLVIAASTAALWIGRFPQTARTERNLAPASSAKMARGFLFPQRLTKTQLEKAL
jgi:hypothetical protein